MEKRIKIIQQAIKDFEKQRDENVRIAGQMRDGSFNPDLSSLDRQAQERAYRGFAASYQAGIDIMTEALATGKPQ